MSEHFWNIDFYRTENFFNKRNPFNKRPENPITDLRLIIHNTLTFSPRLFQCHKSFLAAKNTKNAHWEEVVFLPTLQRKNGAIHKGS